jgi:hypothetical protein
MVKLNASIGWQTIGDAGTNAQFPVVKLSAALF